MKESLVFPAKDLFVDGLQLLLHVFLSIVSKLHSYKNTFSSS